MPHTKTKVSAEIATLRAKLDETTQGWQRTQADFENFRRRTAGEQVERTTAEVGRVLLALTPVAENLRRAIGELSALESPTTSIEQLRAWATGIQSIARQFDTALMTAGLTSLDPTPGEPFNPHEHEALAHQPHADHAADTIVQTIERGYKAGTRVLRPAKVIVSSGAADTQINADTTDSRSQ